MYWDVKTVKPLPDYRIYVEIDDGRKGVFDLKPYLDHGVFRELRDVHYFNQVGILFGAVTWPNDQDIAPETLLAEMIPVESALPNEAIPVGHAAGGAPLSFNVSLIISIDKGFHPSVLRPELEVLADRGLAKQRDLTQMALGPESPAGVLKRIFGLAGPEMG